MSSHTSWINEDEVDISWKVIKMACKRISVRQSCYIWFPCCFLTHSHCWLLKPNMKSRSNILTSLNIASLWSLGVCPVIGLRNAPCHCVSTRSDSVVRIVTTPGHIVKRITMRTAEEWQWGTQTAALNVSSRPILSSLTDSQSNGLGTVFNKTRKRFKTNGLCIFAISSLTIGPIPKYCVGNVALYLEYTQHTARCDYFCTFIILESGKRKIAVRRTSPGPSAMSSRANVINLSPGRQT